MESTVTESETQELFSLISFPLSYPSRFECPHCEFSIFNKKTAFLGHLSRHSMSSSAGQFYCSLCGFSGDATADIDHHIRWHHKQACGEDFDEEEIAGTSRSGNQRKYATSFIGLFWTRTSFVRVYFFYTKLHLFIFICTFIHRIQRSRGANAKVSKDLSKVKPPLDTQDPAYRQKLVAKYSTASLTISSLGLLTDEETNKRKKPQPPVPRVSLKTADWRHAYAAISDAELESRVSAILLESSEASSTSTNPRPKTRQAASASTAKSSSSSFALSLPSSWKKATASPAPISSSASSFSCRICPYVGQTDAEFERHFAQHTSLNDLAEELVAAEMKDDNDDGKRDPCVIDKQDAASSPTAVRSPPAKDVSAGLDGCVGELDVGNAATAPWNNALSATSNQVGESKDPVAVNASSPLKPWNGALTEVTSFKCQFCCHSAKTPLLANRHLSCHFKASLSPVPPTPTTVALTAVEVDDICKRVPGVARRAVADVSVSAAPADSAAMAPVTTNDLETSHQATSNTVNASAEASKLELLENLDEKIKIQGGRSGLDEKDLVSRSIADFRSKILETAGHHNHLDEGVQTLEEKMSPASTRDILEAVKAQTSAMADTHRLNVTGKLDEERDASTSKVGQVTVNCTLCDVALRPEQMSKHAARHGITDSLMTEEGEDELEDDKFSKRMRLKLSSFRREEQRELSNLLLELEDDPVSEAKVSTPALATCRFCCIELEPGKLQNHEARHLGTA